MQSSPTYKLYDAWTTEKVVIGEVESFTAVTARAKALGVEIFMRNIQAGKKGEDIFRVIGIHRVKCIHRHFNLCVHPDDMKPHVLPAVPPDPYGGALSLLEALLDGDWRIASLEEEIVCIAKDNADTARAAREAKTAGTQLGEAAALLRELKTTDF